MSEIEPPVVVYLASRESDPEDSAEALERFNRAAQVVERALDGHDHLVADQFGVADVVCGAVLFFADRFGLIEGLPNVEAYLERLDARPARQRALEIASA
jgi:glutathione S-transferase